MNSNKELLDWAVENIKEWDDYYEYLFVDKTTRVFYSSKKEEWNYDSYGYWASYNQSWVYAKNHMGKPLEYKSINPQVITKQEWLDAKKEKEDMRNTFNLNDLKTGQRITLEDGTIGIVYTNCDLGIAFDIPEEYSICFKPSNEDCFSSLQFFLQDNGSIIKVESPDSVGDFMKIEVNVEYTTIWERQVKSEQDTEKENLQKVIDKLQQDLQNAQQQLDNLGGK